ncbi:MAG: amidohydrolase family protein, partial [Desulfovibrio sp.]|nr:amidohydrolase family protein [Desulfovibrio sp.]
SRPAVYAQSLSLLGPGTLAIHGVRLSRDDIALLGKTGTALCLCPRSNASIGVGQAPIDALLESDVLLCLGTDGLTSCPDLEVRNEIKYLRHERDLPLAALLRMATANGATALGFDYGQFALRVGAPAAFALLDNVD